MRTRTASTVLCAWLGLCAIGCGAHAADIKVPDKPLPAAFASASAAPSIASMSWRAYFADDNLHELIAEALRANSDVVIAVQRIAGSRARVQGAKGATLPRLTASARVGLAKPGRYTPEGAGNASTEITAGQTTPTPVGDFALGLEASWEIDAWGRLSNARKSAVAQYLATVEGLNLVKTGLISTVAREYFELLALDHKREILAETITRQERALEVVRLQKEAGRANQLAVQQFAAQLANTRALAVVSSLRIAELENEINFLRGSYPRTVHRSKDALLRVVPSQAGTGLPSALLRRRPDVRRAEQQVQSSKFDLKAAEAAFYPSLDLAAGIGFEAFNPKFLFETPASLAYSATAGLLAPLVNRAAIEAEFAAAQAMQIEAIYEYQKAVLMAYFEVANALVALNARATTVAHKREQRAAIEQTVSMADALHRAGKATYIDVLLAEQNTLAADLELVDAILAGQQARIEIYRALGGGWDS